VGHFWHPVSEIPHVGTVVLPVRMNFLGNAAGQPGVGWPGPCPSLGEHHVFRAFVLSIVLALAVGQNASLLCAVWCHPQVGPTGTCAHQEPNTSPSWTGNDDCPEVAAPARAFVRENVRREGSAPDALFAVVVPLFQFAPPSHSAFGRKPDHGPPFDTRPLVLALRI
jgi:hypothetical protein